MNLYRDVYDYFTACEKCQRTKDRHRNERLKDKVGKFVVQEPNLLIETSTRKISRMTWKGDRKIFCLPAF